MTATKPTPRFFRVAQTIGIIGVSLLMLNFIYQIWRLHTKNEEKSGTNSCNLMVGSCIKQLPNNQTLELSITPRPIKLGMPSTITVSLTGVTPDRVAILLFPYPVTNSSSNRPIMLTLQKKGIYTGTAVIAETSNPQQKWIAMIMLQNGNQGISVPFQFEV